MRLPHSIEYLALVGFAKGICLLPRPWALGLGSSIGRLGWALGVRRELVIANISNARPDASPAELKQIGKQAARNFGRTVAEFIRYGIKDRDQLSGLIKIEGSDALQAALANGKGAIVLTGHQGSWAIYFAALSMAGTPLSLLVGKQHNEKIDAFIHKIPGDRVEFIPKGRTAIRTILDKLKAGRAVVMVADQHAGGGGIVVPFLGKNASTLSLPGSFAVKYDAPVFIMSGHRESHGGHRVTISPLSVAHQETPEEQKIEVLRAYNHELGKIISTRPEQYFWYHRRWREESDTAPS